MLYVMQKMNLVLQHLATVYPSEGIPDELHIIVWGFFTLAAVIAFIGIVMRVQGGGKPSTLRKVAVAVVLVGLVPAVWYLFIFQMDSPQFNLEGRPSSGSWTSLIVPCLPMLIGCILLIPMFRRQNLLENN